MRFTQLLLGVGSYGLILVPTIQAHSHSSYCGRYLPQLFNEGVVMQVKDALDRVRHDEPLNYVMDMLMAFQVVLPLKEDPLTVSLYYKRTEFLHKLLEHNEHSEIIKENMDAAFALYNVITNNLFVNLDEMKKPEDTTTATCMDSQRSYETIVEPIIVIVGNFLRDWPAHSKPSILFSSRRFQKKLIQLLKSPNPSERDGVLHLYYSTLNSFKELRHDRVIEYSNFILIDLTKMLTRRDGETCQVLARGTKEIQSMASSCLTFAWPNAIYKFASDGIYALIIMNNVESCEPLINLFITAMRRLRRHGEHGKVDKIISGHVMDYNHNPDNSHELSYVTLLVSIMKEGLANGNVALMLTNSVLQVAKRSRNFKVKVSVHRLLEKAVTPLKDSKGNQIEPINHLLTFYNGLSAWIESESKDSLIFEPLLTLWSQWTSTDNKNFIAIQSANCELLTTLQLQVQRKLGNPKQSSPVDRNG